MREHARENHERVLAESQRAVDDVVARAGRIMRTLWLPACRQLAVRQVSAREICAIRYALEHPVSAFDWALSTVEGERLYHLGAANVLAADLVAFLAEREGTSLCSGPPLPTDLVDEYLLRLAFERAPGLAPLQAQRIIRVLLARAGATGRGAALDSALAAFVESRLPAVQPSLQPPPTRHEPGLPSTRRHPDAPPLAAGAAAAGVRAAGVEATAVSQSVLGQWTGLARNIVLLAGLGAFGLLLVLASPPLWAVACVGIGLIVLAAALGNGVAMAFSMLLGIPLELPLHRLGAEDRVLQRHARWLARFLGQAPRTNNTPGAHLAYGVIAVKRTLKALALRRERGDRVITALEQRRSRVIDERNRAGRRVYASLIRSEPSAAEHSRREHAANEELGALETELFARRLEIQAQLVGAFHHAWAGMQRAGLVSSEQHDRARRELQQPPGEAPALLPNGLVRSPVVCAFEYGMFLGRVGMALGFVATFQVSYLGWAIALFALDLYVVEPVVFKLMLSSLGPLLQGPGHKLADLKRYMETELGPGEVLRMPITVPKFSSNPAWNNLNAIIQAALVRSGCTPLSVSPLSMRKQVKHAVIELCEPPAGGAPQQTRRFAEVLRAELGQSRATFPLRAEVSVEGRRVLVTLTDADQKVWDMIGEDASQAFIYLWRNLRALRDSLSHLGPRFQPVFVLASNTEDPDAIEYEIAEIAKLQACSEREYGGQVGFLYLLRGGEWYNYNARLERFDAKDKTFARGLAGVKERLMDPRAPARARLLAALGISAEAMASDGALEPVRVAAAFNGVLGDPDFYREFDAFELESLPPHRHPTGETLSLLARRRAGEALPARMLLDLNRELLLTAFPLRVRGAFFKKVGNDIAVQELLVAGKTRPTTYIDRRVQEHVQDPDRPNYRRVWGDFARYTGLVGNNEQIQAAILEGRDLEVSSVPEVGAILDDKNEFAAGEIEKGLATMLHPDNRHIVIGVPRIDVTLPEHEGRAVASEYILGAQGARAAHNSKDGLTRTRLFSFASPAYGKWFQRPRPYLAHYALESLNAAHALSHDFQQSYLVAGAGGRLSGFSEALYGPTRFEMHAASPASLVPEPALLSLDAGAALFGARRSLGWSSVSSALQRVHARLGSSLWPSFLTWGRER